MFSRTQHRIYLLTFMVASSACSTTLAEDRTCESDEAVVLRRATALGEATKHSDITTLVDMTYPTVVELAGGRSNLIAATKTSMAQMQDAGIRIEKISYSLPTPTYRDGKRSICFVPRDMQVSVKEIRVRAVGYLMAIWDPSGPGKWMYLDSDGFQRNPKLMRQLFPGLPADVQPPPVHTERLQ